MRVRGLPPPQHNTAAYHPFLCRTGCHPPSSIIGWGSNYHRQHNSYNDIRDSHHGINPSLPPASTILEHLADTVPPPKTSKKDIGLEFVDMSEFLPDSWRSQEEEQKCCHQRRVHRRGPVTDILLWVECFSSMVTILSSRFEGKTPHFMAYQQTIVKAHRAFTGEGWITYDTCYRRKAAILKSLDWGVVDFTLYNETFTGRAKSIPRCRHCLSEHHPSHECTYAPDSRVDTLPRTSTRAARMLAPICQLYNGKNGSRCNFNPCKFQHLCADCQGNHPAAYCRKYKSPLTKRPRSRSPPYNSKK